MLSGWRESSLRTAGATSVPNSSIARITFSCAIVPTLICTIKPWWPKSPCSKRNLLCDLLRAADHERAASRVRRPHPLREPHIVSLTPIKSLHPILYSRHMARRGVMHRTASKRTSRAPLPSSRDERPLYRIQPTKSLESGWEQRTARPPICRGVARARVVTPLACPLGMVQ